MKFFLFHLMPYVALDLEQAAQYPTAWVTLPNSLYDPRQGAEIYNRFIDELELADALGFDGVSVNEHHQTAYGLMPTPGVIAGALSRSVKRGRIAVLGRALPLLNNPLQVAEEFAMLDNITRGRLIAGFVRGIGAEYHASGVNPTESHARFHEAHDLIIRAWTEPGPFRHAGRHYGFNYVNVWPTPYQKPHPPVWIPSQGSAETIEWAAASERRYVYCHTYSPIEAVARFMEMYREAAERQGWQAGPDRLAWSCAIHVAETDEKARREAKPHFETFANRLLKMPREMLLPPGYTSLPSMKALAKAKKNLTGEQTLESMLETGNSVVGSPATVVEKLSEYQARAGFGTLLCKLHTGTMPAELTRQNMHLFAEEVMPKLRGLGLQAAAE